MFVQIYTFMNEGFFHLPNKMLNNFDKNWESK